MSKKAIPAKVVKELTKGYLEILLPIDGWNCEMECDRCGLEPCPHFTSESAHAIAETTLDVRRDDIILVKPATAYNTPGARLAYFIIPVMFVVGCLLGKVRGFDLLNTLMAGAILAFLNVVLAWMMNRQARLRRRLEYRVDALLRKSIHRL